MTVNNGGGRHPDCIELAGVMRGVVDGIYARLAKLERAVADLESDSSDHDLRLSDVEEQLERLESGLQMASEQSEIAGVGEDVHRTDDRKEVDGGADR